MSMIDSKPEFIRHAFGWSRIRVVLVTTAILGTLLSLPWTGSVAVLYLRLALLGLALLTVFSIIERWPRKLPGWMARWALQIVAVAAAVPFATGMIYSLTTWGDPAPWFQNGERMAGFGMIAGFSLLVSPWIAMVAVYRDISGRAQRAALAFELERAQLARQALQARMNVLQAQVEPHFLFNTLANIRELVELGAPSAPAMLQSLIHYLRAAVPQLHQSTGTIAQELELVRAYLEIMEMRMPDRLQYSVHADANALDARCPPAAVLVLVENAVRHGIDPGETGGAIFVNARAGRGACTVEVIDTGIGLGGSSDGLGSGLENLRERLRLGFGEDAGVELAPNLPRGVRAVIHLPQHDQHGD